jgi:ATP-dependent DNA helicase RecQ
VLDFLSAPGCLTRRLLDYFGEDLPNDCGHCGRCEGQAPAPIPFSPKPRLGDREAATVRSLRAERHEALAAPRQVARFLCGLPSPSATRAKLTRHEYFGALAGVPFRDVLAFVERQGR